MTKYANPLQISSQSDENDNFRNSAYVVFLAYVDLKNNWWLNSVTWHANPLQISSQWDEN